MAMDGMAAENGGAAGGPWEGLGRPGVARGPWQNGERRGAGYQRPRDRGGTNRASEPDRGANAEKEGRMARSIRLCATYADGYVSEGWRRLSGLTQDAGEIFEESRMVYEEWPHRAVPAVHLELRVGSVAAEAEEERAEARFGIAGAVGAA